jgi:hypothetical protein
MWVEWFKCPFDLAMQGACIGNKNTYYRCLDELQDFGLIKYIKGVNNYKSPLIKLIQLYDNEPLTEQVNVPLSEPLSVPLSEPLSVLLNKNIYKHITNNIETINNKHLEVFLFLKTLDKENIYIPTWDEFLTYGKEKEPKVNIKALKNKYDAWVVNGWRNGNDRPIKNWKSALLQTLIYIEKNNTNANGMVY